MAKVSWSTRNRAYIYMLIIFLFAILTSTNAVIFIASNLILTELIYGSKFK